MTDCAAGPGAWSIVPTDNGQRNVAEIDRTINNFRRTMRDLRCKGKDGCCTKDKPCGLLDGNCENDDSRCENGLKCLTGKDACLSPYQKNWYYETYQLDSQDSCCSLRCGGEDDYCCSEETPCLFGDGDCDNDEECAGDLVCGDNNCPTKGFSWNGGDDCCTKPDMDKKKKLLRSELPARFNAFLGKL